MMHILTQPAAKLACSVGPLLYTPANHKGIASSICTERFGTSFSLALCLEDTINERYLAEAEQQACQTLQALEKAQRQSDFFLPKLFIRLREPAQLERFLQKLGSAAQLLTGFIFPKFSLENGEAYLHALERVNQNRPQPFYMMPVLEDPSLLALSQRQRQLEQLKAMLDDISPQVLNIRVGCSDLCHLFATRRRVEQTIYEILPIANILSDILTVFQADYVVSAPVWEYYQDSHDLWKQGLERELALDQLNGFIGKTVIHPRQIAVVNNSLRVFQRDYEDALQILHWNQENTSYVSGSVQAQRMNEYKTHSNWAQRTLLLAELYGIRPDA